MMQRKRIRPRPLTIDVEGYRQVVLDDVDVKADRATVLGVFLEKRP